MASPSYLSNVEYYNQLYRQMCKAQNPKCHLSSQFGETRIIRLELSWGGLAGIILQRASSSHPDQKMTFDAQGPRARLATVFASKRG